METQLGQFFFKKKSIEHSIYMEILNTKLFSQLQLARKTSPQNLSLHKYVYEFYYVARSQHKLTSHGSHC